LRSTQADQERDEKTLAGDPEITGSAVS